MCSRTLHFRIHSVPEHRLSPLLPLNTSIRGYVTGRMTGRTVLLLYLLPQASSPVRHSFGGNKHVFLGQTNGLDC